MGRPRHPRSPQDLRLPIDDPAWRYGIARRRMATMKRQLFSRRTFVTTATALAAGSLVEPALAQEADWPSRPIRVVLGQAAGSNIDVLVRTVTQALGEELKQPIVVDNKPGASTFLAVQEVARAAPDGYTLLVTVMSSFVGNRVLFQSLPYDPVNGFEPVTQLAYGNVVLVAAEKAPYQNVREFVAWARRQNRAISYGSIGVGSTLHVFGAKLQRDEQLNLNHVPYKSSVAAMQDVANGLLDVTFGSSSDARPLVESGRVKVIAVTGPRRIANMPGVQTFTEQGFKGFDLSVWTGAYLPARTPRTIVDRMNQALVKVLHEAAVRDKLEAIGHTPIGNSPAEFRRNYDETYPLWREYILQSGATPS
jgi:tripartite-type tricarboxylate transporter receptor subunit TctC